MDPIEAAVLQARERARARQAAAGASITPNRAVSTQRGARKSSGGSSAAASASATRATPAASAKPARAPSAHRRRGVQRAHTRSDSEDSVSNQLPQFAAGTNREAEAEGNDVRIAKYQSSKPQKQYTPTSGKEGVTRVRREPTSPGHVKVEQKSHNWARVLVYALLCAGLGVLLAMNIRGDDVDGVYSRPAIGHSGAGSSKPTAGEFAVALPQDLQVHASPMNLPFMAFLGAFVGAALAFITDN